MAGEWADCTLGDVLTLQRGFDLPAQERSSGPYPIIASTGEVGTHTEAMVKAPGVVIGRSGSLGGGQYVTHDFWPLNTTLWVKDFKGNHIRFCYYLLKSIDFSKFNVGGAVPTLNRNHIHPHPVRVPRDIDEQRAIAHVLGTLDDKIELNRRMNETLEAIARAIFKSWFVDFDPVRAKASGEPPESICHRLGLIPDLLALFPDRLVDSELGEIPEGWEIRTVEDLSLKVGMGPFGSNIKVSTFVEQGIPIISGQHLNDTMLEDNTFRFISVEHADRLASANVGRGDIVFTHAGNIGQVSYIPDHSQYERYVLSQRQFYLRCDLSQISPLFMVYFFRSPLGQHKLLANASQVGVPSIARPVSYLKSIELVTPPSLLVDKYDEIVRPLHHRITSARTEIETLSGLRGTLLPKLLSGALRVPVAEDEAEVTA